MYTKKLLEDDVEFELIAGRIQHKKSKKQLDDERHMHWLLEERH